MSAPIPRATSTRLLYASAFVIAVDAAGAGHLFPALAGATHAPTRGASWFLSAYMLGALVGAPLLARAAAHVGRLRVLAWAIGLFAIASFVVGISFSYPLAIASRFAQGLGGSAIMPLAAAQLGAKLAFDDKRSPENLDTSGRELGLLSLAYAIGFLAGIVFVSLFLLVSFRLAYVFTGTLALGLTLALARASSTASERVAPAVFHAPRWGTVVAWFLVLALTSFAVNHATLTAREMASMSVAYQRVVRASQIVAAPAVALFAWRDGLSPSPLLAPSAFRTRFGLATTFLSLAAGVGQASVVVLPTCAMVLLGVSAAASGPMLAPIVVGGLTANILVSARLDRWGPTPFLTIGLVLIAVGDVLAALFGARMPAFLWAALLLGTGVSLMSSGALRYLAARDVAVADAEASQASISLLTNVGVLMGSALWGAIAASASTQALAVRYGLMALSALVSLALVALPFVARRKASHLRGGAADGVGQP